MLSHSACCLLTEGSSQTGAVPFKTKQDWESKEMWTLRSEEINFNFPHPPPGSQDTSNSGQGWQNARALLGAREASEGSRQAYGPEESIRHPPSGPLAPHVWRPLSSWQAIAASLPSPLPCQEDRWRSSHRQENWGPEWSRPKLQQSGV